ncbi:MAG: hypothetical protein HUJ26_22230 [Planctomycetaceae bacterium]|nr:hypothetical protein [Planctomycetaceae bacterium]
MTDQLVPESRVYRHRQCGEETTVGDQSFETVSNPMSSMERTYCSSCGAMFEISEFEWSDTGETIADYYARHSQNATPSQRFLTSKKFMLLVILIIALPAAGGAFVLLANSGMLVRLLGAFGGFIVGAFIGMMIFVEAFAKPITKKVCGVTDTRTLT